MTPESWERVRALRLTALRDTPGACAMTVEEELARAPESWQERLEEGCGAATFLASHEGCDVGIVVGAKVRDCDNLGGLYAMWVAPEARGTGISNVLVKAVIQWARERGFLRLVLDVADDNAPAIELYARHGFEPTGVRGVLAEPRSHIMEHERALDL